MPDRHTRTKRWNNFHGGCLWVYFWDWCRALRWRLTLAPSAMIYKADQTTCCVNCCFCLTASLLAGCRERLQQTTKRRLTQGLCPDNHTVLARSLIGPLHIWLQECFDTYSVKTRRAKGWSCRHKACNQNLGPLSPLSSMATTKNQHIDEDTRKASQATSKHSNSKSKKGLLG